MTECEFLKNNNIRYCLEFKKNVLERIESYLGYVKDQEESIKERTLNK